MQERAERIETLQRLIGRASYIDRTALGRCGLLECEGPEARKEWGAVNDNTCGSFGEAASDIQAQKMDWCSIGPRGLTRMHCIALAMCSLRLRRGCGKDSSNTKHHQSQWAHLSLLQEWINHWPTKLILCCCQKLGRGLFKAQP
jgi:hypothetical protein